MHTHALSAPLQYQSNKSSKFGCTRASSPEKRSPGSLLGSGVSTPWARSQVSIGDLAPELLSLASTAGQGAATRDTVTKEGSGDTSLQAEGAHMVQIHSQGLAELVFPLARAAGHSRGGCTLQHPAMRMCRWKGVPTLLLFICALICIFLKHLISCVS